MQKQWNPLICACRLSLLFAAIGLLAALSGCSEYKPAGPVEGESSKVQETGEQAG